MDERPQPQPEFHHCVICGYDLTGLSPSGICPECATPVERSLSGDELVYSAPEYVASLRRGSFLIIAAIIMYMLNLIAAFVIAATLAMNSPAGPATFGTIDIVSSLISLAAAAMTFVGWWLFSAPDPRLAGVHTGSQARVWVRIAIAIQAVLSLGSAGVMFLIVSAPNSNVSLALAGLMMAVGLINFVATGVWYFASMIYLRWLAPRLPNAKVFKRAKTMMWLGPLLVIVGGLCIMIGPLIALVLYWNMIYWVWKDLKAIQDRQNGLHASEFA